MEKISIRPTATDIVIGTNSENELNEVFSYNYGQSSLTDQDALKRLGSLFIVGQIQPRSEETSYVLNLIAGLAKREYYLASNDSPKEGFSKTLKKINEALEDFFKEKELKTNIGVFAIASDQILISKLGKFKIIIGRDNQIIDPLNNINLFNKEQQKETQFSSVISGKILPEDKILAYYPSRSVVSREKSLKLDLLKAPVKDFAEALSAIHKKNNKFSISSIHLTIDKFKEPAVIKRPQPKELEPENIQETSPALNEPILASKPLKHPGNKETESPVSVSVATDSHSADINIDVKNKPDLETGNKAPLIIPSEFGMAKKSNIFSETGRTLGSATSAISNIGRAGLAGRLFFFTIACVVIVGLAFGAKVLILDRNTEEGIDAALMEIESNLKLAKTKINQNELASARQILSGALFSILSLSNNEKVEPSKNDVIATLDSIDKAVDASPTLIFNIDNPSGVPLSVLASGSRSYVLTSDNKILIKDNDGSVNSVDLEGTSPGEIFNLNGKILGIDSVGKKIVTINPADRKANLSENIAFPENTISNYVYESNLYILTSDNIARIIDVGSSKNQISNWLSEKSNLPANPKFIVVDGNIYILDGSGVITEYFRGEKKSEKNIDILPDENMELLTTPDSMTLYLINNRIGRIYFIGKLSGKIEKVVKINNSAEILDASIDNSENIYILTNDNKVWKISR